MLTMPKITSLGGALDALGRAAAPSAPASMSRPAPQTMTAAFDDMAAVFGTPRTVEEARVDHSAAAGWQIRAPTFGRAVGVGVGVGLGAIAARALRAAFGGK